MSDYVEVTRRGFFSRGKDSLGGAFMGVIVVLIMTVVLFWNEGRARKRYLDLKEGAGSVVSVASDKVDPATEGKLVHLTGETKVGEPLTDPDFGISLPAVKLIRDVEIYQWVEVVKTETRNKVGGGTEEIKTYSYERQWRDSPVDSSRFKVSSEHRNPTEMKVRSATFTAGIVTLGAFTLPDFLVAQIGGGQPYVPETLDQASGEIRSAAKISEGLVYFGADPRSPAVGDLRVRFSRVPTGPVSVIAQQSGATFVPFRTKTGGTVDLLELGTIGAQDMFKMAQDRNKMLTWAIRIFGFFILGIGFSMVLRPIAVLASILPFLGRLVGTGTTVVAFLLGGIVWCLTVSIAWIFYRPILGISILAITVVLLVMVVKRLRGRGASAPPLPAGPPPLT
jgi:hypothetical protein